MFGTSGVTLTGSTTFNAAATAVTLGAVSGSYNLILAGSGTDVIASASLGTGVLDLSGVTGGSVTVSGSLTAGDLTVPTATQSFDVALSGGGTITSNVDFTNQDGSLTIGSSGFEFSAGATKTIGTKSFGGGTISASSGGLLFGTSGVTLTGSTTFNAAATAVTLGAVSGSYNLILAGSGTDVIASASLGTGVLDLSGMTGGSVTVSGSLTAGDLTVPTATQSFDVALSGGGTITNNVDFTNQDGSLTIGSSGFEFSAGATKTIGTKSFGGGTISASSGGLLFGTSGVTLTGSTTFNAAATAVTLGAVSGSYNLILAGSGTDVIASASLGTGVLDLSGMTGGSVTVSGSLTAGDLTVPTATQSFDVALSGGGTITSNVDFTNQDGSLTIGSSGFEFSAGATFVPIVFVAPALNSNPLDPIVRLPSWFVKSNIARYRPAAGQRHVEALRRRSAPSGPKPSGSRSPSPIPRSSHSGPAPRSPSEALAITSVPDPASIRLYDPLTAPSVTAVAAALNVVAPRQRHTARTEQ